LLLFFDVKSCDGSQGGKNQHIHSITDGNSRRNNKLKKEKWQYQEQ